MANSFNIVHEMTNKVGFEFDDVQAKAVERLAKRAGKLAADGMTTELSGIVSQVADIFNTTLTQLGKQKIDFTKLIEMPNEHSISKMTSTFIAQMTGNIGTALMAEKKTLESELKILQERERLLRRAHTLYKTDVDNDTLKSDREFDGKSAKVKDFHNYQWKDRGNEDAMVAEFDNAVDALRSSVAEVEQIIMSAAKAGTKAKLSELEPHLFRAIDLITQLNEMRVSLKDLPKGLSYDLSKIINVESIVEASTFSDEFTDKTNKFSIEEYIPTLLKANGIKLEEAFQLPVSLSGQIEADTGRLNEIVEELQEIQKQAAYTVASIDDVNEAVAKRYVKDKSKPIAQAEINQVSKVIDGGFANGLSLKKTYEQYEALSVTGDFVDKYKALLQFVNFAEQQMASGKSLGKYAEHYDQLKNYVDVAKESLSAFIAKAEEVNKNKVDRVGFEKYVVADNIDKIEAGKGITGASPEEADNAERLAEANKKAADEAERKAKADRESAELADRKLKAEQEALRIIEQKRAAEGAVVDNLASSLQKELEKTNLAHVEMSRGAIDAQEAMRLVGASGIQDVVMGSGYEVETTTLVEQLLSNLKNSILMSLHDHPDGILAFTPSDIKSFAGLYYDQGIKIHGIIANGIIQTIDFSGISKDVAIKIGDSFSVNLKNNLSELSQFFSYDNGNIIPTEAFGALSADIQQELTSAVLDITNVSLVEAFQQQGVEPTINAFDGNNLSELAEYLIKIQESSQATLTPVEKLKNLITTIKPGQISSWDEYSDIIKQFESGAIDGVTAVNQINERLTNTLNVAEQKKQVEELLKQLDVLRTQASESDDADELNDVLEKRKQILTEINQLEVPDYSDEISKQQKINDEIVKQIELFRVLDGEQESLGDGSPKADDAAEQARIATEQVEAERQATEEKLKQAQLEAEANAEAAEELQIAKQQIEIAQNAQMQAEKESQRIQENLELEKQLRAEKEEQARIEAEARASAEEKLRLAKEQLAVEQASREAAELEANTLKSENADYGARMYEANEDRDRLRQANADLHAELDAKNKLLQSASSVDDQTLKNILSAITYNVKVVSDVQDADASKVAIDEQSLKAVLEGITYNTKTISDEAPIDDTQAPWALEDTLKNQTNTKLDSIKTVLDNINAQDASDKSVAVADVGNVLATENTLSAIKTAIEAINKKTIQGTKTTPTTSEANKSPQQKKTSATANQKGTVKELISLYTQLGQLEARRDMTASNIAEEAIADDEIIKIQKLISEKRKLITVNQELENQFADAQFTGMEKELTKPVVELRKQYEELGRIRAKVDTMPPSDVRTHLEEQIKLQEKLIATESKRLGISRNEQESFDIKMDEAYYAERQKLEEKANKARDAARRKDQADAFKEAERARQKQERLDQKRARKDAMTDKASSVFNRGRNTYLSALSIDNFEALPKDFKNQINSYIDVLEKLEETQYKLSQSEIITDEEKADLINQTINANKLTDELNELITQYQKLSGDNVDPLPGTHTLGKGATLEQYRQQLTEAVKAATHGQATIKGFDDKTKTLTYTVKIGSRTFKEYTAVLRELDGQMVAVGGTTKKTESFLEASKRKLKEISSYVSAMSTLNRIGQELRRGIQYVREIDSAMTELRKVTEATDEAYDKFLKTASKTAEKVGTTMQKVISSSADWARIGYSMEDAAQLAETTSVLLNVSEFQSIDEATSALTSTLQAFSMTAEQSMKAVDVLNEVGKKIIARR